MTTIAVKDGIIAVDSRGSVHLRGGGHECPKCDESITRTVKNSQNKFRLVDCAWKDEPILAITGVGMASVIAKMATTIDKVTDAEPLVRNMIEFGWSYVINEDQASTVLIITETKLIKLVLEVGKVTGTEYNLKGLSVVYGSGGKIAAMGISSFNLTAIAAVGLATCGDPGTGGAIISMDTKKLKDGKPVFKKTLKTGVSCVVELSKDEVVEL